MCTVPQRAVLASDRKDVFEKRKTGNLRDLEADRKAAPEAAENLINAFIVTAPYVFREPMCHERKQYELSLEQIFE